MEGVLNIWGNRNLLNVVRSPYNDVKAHVLVEREESKQFSFESGSALKMNDITKVV